MLKPILRKGGFLQGQEERVLKAIDTFVVDERQLRSLFSVIASPSSIQHQFSILMSSQTDAAHRSAKPKRCQQCATRKKKCDLTTPKCGRCCRVGLKCSFELLSSINERDAPRNAFGSIQAPGSRFTQPGFHFDDSAVILFARSVANNLAGSIGPYLDGFNKWLPVVDGSDLEARCQNADSFEDETVPTLVLACTLLSRVSTTNPDNIDMDANHELYLMLTTSHTSLLSRGVTSLYLLQSKILVALYEYLQDNRIAVLGTLTSAAAMAKAMGLLRWHCQTRPGVISVDTAQYRAVCCLYVLERIIHATYLSGNETTLVGLSCPRPCFNRMVSNEKGGLTRLISFKCEKCDDENQATPAAYLNPGYPSLLSRLVQAALLLEMAMEKSARSSKAETPRDQPVLEIEISRLASDLHADRCRGAQVNCSVLGICVSCILILNNRTDSTDSSVNWEHIAAALRMVFDRLNIVPAFQYEFSRVISLWELHCFYLAAKTCEESRGNLEQLIDGDSADRALGVISTTLRDYSASWTIAGNLLSKIQ